MAGLIWGGGVVPALETIPPGKGGRGGGAPNVMLLQYIVRLTLRGRQVDERTQLVLRRYLAGVWRARLSPDTIYVCTMCKGDYHTTHSGITSAYFKNCNVLAPPTQLG